MKHENIEKAKFDILESLNIGSKIESIAPLTMQGSQLKANLIKSFNEGAMDTVVGVSNAIFESSKLQAIDEQVYSFAHTCSEDIVNAGLKAKIVYAYECIQNKNEDVIIGSARKTYDALVVLEEAEIKSSIRAGVLNPFRTLPFVKEIIESAKIISTDVVESDVIVAMHPVTHTEVFEGALFFRNSNKVYAMNEKGMVESNAPSSKFAYISGIVESLDFNSKNNTFAFEHETLGKFQISESGLARENSEGSYEILENAEFIKSMNMIIESQNLSGRTATNVAKSQRSTADALIAIAENFKSISVADNIIECYNKKNGNRVILVDNTDKFHVAVVESVRLPKIIETFTNIKDALAVFEAKTSFDATNMCAHIIEKCEIESSEKKEAIAEQRSLVEELQTRRDTLIESIETSESEEKDKLQAVLEGVDQLIVEQTNLLNTLLK